jgi:uncharacterized membrane protein
VVSVGSTLVVAINTEDWLLLLLIKVYKASKIVGDNELSNCILVQYIAFLALLFGQIRFNQDIPQGIH